MIKKHQYLPIGEVEFNQL